MRIGLAALATLVPTAIFAGGPVDPQPEPYVTAPATVARADGQFYVGGAIGYGTGGDDEVGIRGETGPTLDLGTLKNKGGTASLYAGWRRSFGALGFGLEAGIMGGDVSSDVSSAGYDAEMSLNSAVSLRLVTSVPVRPDTTIYAFGGAAYGDFDYRVAGDGGLGTADIDRDVEELGYTIGLGTEYSFGDNLALRSEVQYMNFGKVELEDRNGIATNATPDFFHAQIGLTFRF